MPLLSDVVFTLDGRDSLKALPLFCHLEGQAIFTIASKMKPLVMYPGEDVTNRSSEVDALYVLEVIQTLSVSAWYVTCGWTRMVR